MATLNPIEALEGRVLLDGGGPAGAGAMPVLLDINPAPISSSPTPLAEIAGRILFCGNGAVVGYEPWITEGSMDDPPGGARLLADIGPGTSFSLPHNAGTVGSGAGKRVIFWATDPASNWDDRLWVTDGTPAGTSRLSATHGLGDYDDTPRIVSLGGRAYFFAVNGGAAGIHSTDGTPEGTRLEAAVPKVAAITAGPDALYFIRGGGLWRLGPGTAPAQLASGVDPAQPLIVIGPTVLFTRQNLPWMSDGTPEGTRQVPDTPTSGTYPLQNAVALADGRIAFFAYNHLYVLSADGASSVRAGRAVGGRWRELAAMGNTIILSGRLAGPAPTNGALYASDGTADSVRLLRTFALDPTKTRNTEPAHLTAVGAAAAARVVFAAEETLGDVEPWVTDGTPEGTRRLVELAPGPGGTDLCAGRDYKGNMLRSGAFFTAAGKAYMTVTEPVHGTELWITDGTPEGTMLLADSTPATADGASTSYVDREGVALDGVTYFAATSGDAGRELWRTDGTAAGTWRVADLLPGSASSNPHDLRAVGDLLYFVATTRDATGAESAGLFRSDGTAAGTWRLAAAGGYEVRVIEPAYGPATAAWAGGIAFAGTVVGGDGTVFIYASDGTAAGTRPLGRALSADAGVRGLASAGADLYFEAYIASAAAARDLCWHDGTDWSVALADHDVVTAKDLGDGGLLVSMRPGGTGMPPGLFIAGGGQVTPLAGPTAVYQLVVGDAGVYAFAEGSAAGAIWWTDGTPGGTRKTADLDGVTAVSGATWARGRLWFYARTDAAGWEPWVSDGTSAGTRMLADLHAGAGSSMETLVQPYTLPRFTAGPDGRIYFQATTPATGIELFSTDGTAEGTRLEADLAPGPASTIFGPFLRAGGSLFLSAPDPWAGREWRQVVADASPPRAIDARFESELSHAVRIVFDEEVGPTLEAGDLVVTDSAGIPVPGPWTLARRALADGSVVATWTYAGGGPLPDGPYRARLAAGAVADLGGRPLAEEVTVEFTVLAGDATGDGAVDAADYHAIDRGHALGLRGRSNGDANLSGDVPDADDYAVMDAAFLRQARSRAADPAATPSASPARATPPGVAMPFARSSADARWDPAGDDDDVLG